MHLMITFITFVFFSNGSFFFFFQSSLIYIKERNKVPSADHLYVFLIHFFFFSLKQFFFFTAFRNRRQVRQSTGEIGKTEQHIVTSIFVLTEHKSV